MRAVRGPVAIALAALLFGVAGEQLFFARAAGLNVLVATTAFLVLGWWQRRRGVRFDPLDLWLPAAAVAFAALCAVRTDAAVVAFDAAVSATMAVATLVALGGVGVTRLEARAVSAEGVDLIAGIVDRPVHIARAASGPIRSWLRLRTGRLSRYLAGAALASPFLIVFSALFASADPVFFRWANDLIDTARWRELLRDAGPRVALLSLIAWLAAAAFGKLADPPAAHTPHRVTGIVHVEAATVVLACVDLLFGLFVALQIGYLFGGRDTLEAAGVPYSAYARRGFFELIGCASLVGALLFGLNLQPRARSRITIALGLVLVALTLVVLASAWYRLELYQLAYGWTELRFYAVTGIVFLAIALPIVGSCVAADRMRHALQPLAGAALLVAISVNALSPSAFVARADLQRFIDPSGLPEDAERRMDPSYLVSLGDGAFPVLIELMPQLAQADRDRLALLLRPAAAHVRDPQPWESFNVDRARSKIALESLR